MSEVTNKEFREAYPSHFTSKRTLNHAFRLFLGSSLATGLLASCAPVSPEAPSPAPTETEAFNLLNYLLKEAKSYSEVETKESQKLLGLKELTVVNASKEFEVTIDWGKVSQLPDTESLQGKRLSMIFIDEFTPTMEEELKKSNSDPDSATWARDDQIVMVFPLGRILIPETPANSTEEHNHFASDVVYSTYFLHEFAHVLHIFRVGLEEYSRLFYSEAYLPRYERSLEFEAREYAGNNQMKFLDGVKVRRRSKEESHLIPSEELEVQAFFHWLGVRERLLKDKDEVPFYVPSRKG